MIPQKTDLKVCKWCGRSEEETPFQKAQKSICSECRQGIPKEIVDASNVFYTYKHVCPYSNDVVYVGKGVNYRAMAAWGSGGRDPDHASWMYKRLTEGTNPHSLCVIHDYGMTSQEAEHKEAMLKRNLKHAGHTLRFCKDI